MPFIPTFSSTGSSGSSSSGGGTPGGSTTQIQYNLTGTFAGSSALTFNNSTNTVTLGGELNIEGEVGQSASTAYLRVRDSSTNELFKVQGDGVLHNLRGTVVPVYRNASVMTTLDINTTTAADRTYMFLSPSGANRSVFLKSSPENGRAYVISHIGSGFLLNIRDASGSTNIVSISPQFSALVVYDGSNWVNIA